MASLGIGPGQHEGLRPPTSSITRPRLHNTIRDLLGHDLRLAAELFPADASGGEGFDNHADTLFLPPLLLEGYWNATRIAVPLAPRLLAASGLRLRRFGDADQRLLSASA